MRAPGGSYPSASLDQGEPGVACAVLWTPLPRWETNELARQLEAEGMVAEAAVMLELNEEFHPRDASIPRTLGPLYEALRRTDDAVAAYRRALGLNPRDQRSLERLQALTGG